jgi:hypothetical protein
MKCPVCKLENPPNSEKCSCDGHNFKYCRLESPSHEANMSNFLKRALFWTPRILSIAFIAFLSIFALDAFDGRHGFWQTMLAFVIHQIPVFVLIGALILAWRWEWIGMALYAAFGLFHITWTLFIQHHIPPAAIPIAILLIDGPALIIAALFLANWLKRGELRKAES